VKIQKYETGCKGKCYGEEVVPGGLFKITLTAPELSQSNVMSEDEPI
jgi:hypothetical protein